MDGGGLHAVDQLESHGLALHGLPDSGRRFARGRRQFQAQIGKLVLDEFDGAGDGVGLAGAGTARQQRQLVLAHDADTLKLAVLHAGQSTIADNLRNILVAVRGKA